MRLSASYFHENVEEPEDRIVVGIVISTHSPDDYYQDGFRVIWSDDIETFELNDSNLEKIS